MRPDIADLTRAEYTDLVIVIISIIIFITQDRCQMKQSTGVGR
jgi:hypothetical protein